MIVHVLLFVGANNEQLKIVMVYWNEAPL